MAGNLEETMINIDQLDANNPEHMEQLIQAISAGAAEPVEGTPAPAAKADDKADDTTATPAAEPAATKADDAAPASPATEDTKAPVATRDGKNTIPYSVLEAAREGKAKAEAAAQQEREQREALAKQLEEKLARIKELEERGASTTAAEKEEVSDLKADLEAISEEAPYLAGVLGKLIARVEATEKVASEAKKPPNTEPTAPSMPPELRDAIDAVPPLAHWEAGNAELFAAAVEVDNRLKTRPEWANKPMKERFEQVVKVMVAEYGDSILPPADSQKTTTPPTAAKELPKADDVAIHSISDIPGGTPTAQNALQDIANASPTAIFNKLQSMESPEDIIRFVTR